jgi:hypothetical protein
MTTILHSGRIGTIPILRGGVKARHDKMVGLVETILKRETNTESRNMLPTWAPRVTQR